MVNYIGRYILNLLVRNKFRSVKLRQEGIGCVYKGLRSTFLYADKLSFGNFVHVGPGALLDAAGTIGVGDGTILAPAVHIYSRSHNFDEDVQALPFDNVMLVAPVRIGRYVWIGARAIILPGVTIGDGAVIGAGAVVAKDVPSCAVAVGNPARVVRYRDSERFERLLGETEPFVYQKFAHAKVFRARHAGASGGCDTDD